MFLSLAHSSARKSVKPEGPDGDYASDLENGAPGVGRGAKKRRRTICYGRWRYICFSLLIFWVILALYFTSSLTRVPPPIPPPLSLSAPPPLSTPLPLHPAPLQPPPSPLSPPSYADASPAIAALLASVTDAARHSWKGYIDYARAHDEIRPSTNTTNDSWGGFGVTAVDALDTLWLLGMQDEFKEAVTIALAADWTANDYEASFFETTIRYVGGLLSAFYLTEDTKLRNDALLASAAKLVEALLPALNTPTSLPLSVINLKTSVAHSPKWARGCCVLAEAGSVQLEWLSLQDAIVRSDPSTAAAAAAAASAGCASMKTLRTLDALVQSSGSALLPTLVDTSSGKGCNQEYSVGALADSYYEYLLKVWLLGGRADEQQFRMFSQAAAAIERDLVRQTAGGWWYVSESSGGKLTHRMDHLACFWPGTLALASMSLKDAEGGDAADAAAAYLDLAQRLASTCAQLALSSPSGLAPETVSFNPTAAAGEPQFSVVKPGYHLRPEILESMFYLWRATKDEKYRQWGAEIWRAISELCRTQSAFSGVVDVQQSAAQHSNSMPSYFLAETVKYAWLLFSDDSVLSLTDYVLSTEAHPLPLLQRRIHCGGGEGNVEKEMRGGASGDGVGDHAAGDDAAAPAALGAAVGAEVDDSKSGGG